jgi:hypothetical protein
MQDRFESRVGQPDGMRKAFLRLLHNINSHNETPDNDDRNDEVFEDTLESQAV